MALRRQRGVHTVRVRLQPGQRAQSYRRHFLLGLRQFVTPRSVRTVVAWPPKRLYQHFLGAPSRTRTDTVRILSPLPLPIGLWGPAGEIDGVTTVEYRALTTNSTQVGRSYHRGLAASRGAAIVHPLSDRSRGPTPHAATAKIGPQSAVEPRSPAKEAMAVDNEPEGSVRHVGILRDICDGRHTKGAYFCQSSLKNAVWPLHHRGC